MRGFAATEATYVRKLNEDERRQYDLGVEDGKSGLFRQQGTEPYREGLIAGYLAWQIFLNDTEDHARGAQPCGSLSIDRTEVFVPLVIAERDKLRMSRQICCEEAHIPFAHPDLSDVEGVTAHELCTLPD